MPGKATPKAPAPDSPVFSMLTEWVRQGTESFFATQRILLDLVVRQNSHTFKAIRERLVEARSAPAAMLTEIAGEGISNFIAAQRVLLQLAQRQNEIVMTGVKERALTAPLGALTDMLRRSIDTLIDMHQHFLTTAAKQADLWIDATREGKPFEGKPVNELVREAMENFIRSQKKFLDVVAEETAHATEASHNGKHARKTELTTLARQAAEALLDAQKKLLDVAAQQVTVNGKAVREGVEKLNPFPALQLADITRNTVESFVTAQKALLDAMAKRGHHAPAAEHTPLKTKRAAAKHHKPAPVPVPA
jgi:hypothetical protein